MTQTLAGMIAAQRGERDPSRASLRGATLTGMGYENVDVLGGGLIAWDEAGLPVEREHQPATT